MAVACNYDAHGALNIFDTETWKPLLTQKVEPEGLSLAMGRGLNAAAFSPEGRRIVVGGNIGPARVLDAQTGRLRLELVGHTEAITTVAYSPDGLRIATGSLDQTVKLWNATTGREVFTFRGHYGPVTAVEFSKDGSRLVSAGDDGVVRIWDAGSPINN